MNINKIGSFIKQLREEQGMTQEQLAEKIPISREGVSKWERAKNFPDINTIKKLSEIFDVSIDELLCGERNPKENIALELYSQRNKIKRNLKLLIILLVIIIISFFTYYFINQYKSIKVYTISGIGENYIVNDGLIVLTNEKLFFYIGNISNNDIDNKLKIDKIELYYNSVESKNLIYESDSNNISFYDYNGYNEYWNFDNNIEKTKFYILIYYNGTYEQINLILKKDYINDNLIFKKEKNIENNHLNNPNYFLNISEKTLQKFKKVNDNYVYTFEDKKSQENIEIIYNNASKVFNLSIFDIKKSTLEKIFIIDFEYKNLKYYNYVNNEINYSFIYDGKYKCLTDKCVKKEEMEKNVSDAFNILKKALE